MVYKKFYVQIVVRILLMFLSGFIFLQILDRPNFLYIQLLMLGLTIGQIFLLIRFLNRINRKLTLFFESVKTDNYHVKFISSQSQGEFDELNMQLDQLSAHFKDVIFKREEQDEYFKAVIEHVGIGIFAYDAKGFIRFINSECLQLFGLTMLKNIFALDFAHKGLSKFFQNLKPGQQQLLELKRGNEILQLAAKVTKYKISGEDLNLLSLQNIKPELDLKETETWQKMIRILTHEIMNSVSPITSLANSLSSILNKKNQDETQLKNKLEKGLSAIKNRGEGMMDFVRKYRNLTILPLPQITEIKLKNLMAEIEMLFEEDFKSNDISFRCNFETNELTVKADKEQIEQVLINLVKNAIWAVTDAELKKIDVKVTLNKAKRIQIEVSDSGFGLNDELLDKIFIPFFTTREEGSGIGLSLARQIMLMHGGSISAHSNEGKGATFVLVF